MKLNRVKQVNRQISVVLAILMVVGCGDNDIPDIKLEINQKELDKLVAYAPIKLTVPRVFFSSCQPKNIYSKSYYITSKGTSIGDKFAYWVCDQTLLPQDCPEMTIAIANETAMITNVEASKDDYSKKQVMSCALSVIKRSPTEKTVTPNYKNSESWN